MENGLEKMAVGKFMPTKKSNLIFLLVSFVLFSCISCTSTKKTPYKINGELFLTESSVAKNAGMEIIFTNLSENIVKAFTFVAYAFDEEGQSLFCNKNNLVMRIEKFIYANEEYTFNLNLDEYVEAEDLEKLYEIEYLYVSRIEYEDGFIWTDSFGLEKM